METRFIVVTGGVISGVGKGVTTASLGKILKEHGYKTTLIKIDPYINYDAGTLRPTEHGEVWVTDDGGEIDQDLGTYERFIDQSIPKKNNITTGQIYYAVIKRERNGEYLGQTVQFMPHIIDEIKDRILQAAQGYEIAIIELGGTVGDYENTPYLFAFKALEQKFGLDHVAHLLVTYLPIPEHIHEMKTKPTQQAIRMLWEEGIIPDFVICRAQKPVDDIRRKKIELCVNIPSDHIISAPNIETIYELPINLEKEKLGQKLLDHLKLKSRKQPNWDKWQQLVNIIKKPEKKLSVAVVGKYLDIGDYHLTDSYLSIYQALIHAAAEHAIGVEITWIDAKKFETNAEKLSELQSFAGIIIPGGFGSSGIDGKIKTIEYVRKHHIPFLGLCYGLQLAVVEFARNVCGLPDAHTTEVDKKTTHPIIDILPQQKEILTQGKYGGTMRLGAYRATLDAMSSVSKLYGSQEISERHRHRYEVNPEYIETLQGHGLRCSGYHTREDGTKLVEFIELPMHPFFVATQAHPEFKSRLSVAHPLFLGFVVAMQERVGAQLHTKPYRYEQPQD